MANGLWSGQGDHLPGTIVRLGQADSSHHVLLSWTPGPIPGGDLTPRISGRVSSETEGPCRAGEGVGSSIDEAELAV